MIKDLKFLSSVFLGIFLSGCGIFGPSPLKYSGTLEMTEHSVGAQVSGRLATLTVTDGDTIQKGQLIGTLDRFDQAKKDYDRLMVLYKEGGVDAQQTEHAYLAMRDQQIISPVDGVVLLKVHETGEIVAAGSAVAVIGDSHDLWVRIFVPEGRINQVRLDQPALLRFDGLKGEFKGHVSFVGPKAEFTPRNVQTPEERVTQTFAVKVSLDDAAVPVHPGVSADVTLHADQEK